MDRPDVFSRTNGVSGANQKGFNSRAEAEKAYAAAYALGTVRVLSRDGSQASMAPAAPMPQEILDEFKSVRDDFLGTHWYVVFKGKSPGVYPTW